MSTGVLLSIALLLAASGVALLVVGGVGRRRGHEARCAHCKYELTGLTADAVCPECGSVRRRLGLRKRRPIVALFGAVIVLIASAPVFTPFRRWYETFDWYTVAPDGVLQYLVESNDDIRAADMLARRWIDGELTDEQAEALFRALVRVEIRTRPHRSDQLWAPLYEGYSTIVAPNELGVPMAPDDPLNALWRTSSTLDEEGNIKHESTGSGMGGVNATTSLQRLRSPEEPAEFSVIQRFRIESPDRSRAIEWREEHTVVSEVAAPDFDWPGLELLNDPASTSKVSEAFLNPEYRILRFREGGGWRSGFGVENAPPGEGEFDYRMPFFEAPDIPLFAEIEIQQGGTRFALRSLRHVADRDSGIVSRDQFSLQFVPFAEREWFARSAGSASSANDDSGLSYSTENDETWRNQLMGESILVVRSNPEAAWYSPKIERVWDGELRFRIRVNEEGVEVIERLP
ncbi:MAG: hypothetical protein ACF8PN_03155 [Phycisphaerales bacterium]